MSFTMFKRNYYYLISGLPDMIIDGAKPRELSLEFKKEIKEQLHISDYKLAQLFYLQYDNKNLLNKLLKQDKPFITLGNYTEEYLNEQIKEPTDIVEYMAHQINNFKAETHKNSDLNWENSLQALYYEYVLQVKNSFIKQWFKFDRDMKNILTAVNCKKYNYNIENQLIPVKHYNEIYDIMVMSEPKIDILTHAVPYADEIIQIAESEVDITDKEKAIDLIKWKYLDEYSFFNYFTIEKVLCHIIKLEIIERWIKLDSETGKTLFNKLIHDIKTSYEFSEEFSLVK
ncbi:MAG: DUF2764 family protein [Salinivirgaceae bacterium]|jgi:hypothetical protein|nr:DUF2764 family protein [Salinivirgaceae bacterium]